LILFAIFRANRSQGEKMQKHEIANNDRRFATAAKRGEREEKGFF